VREAFKTLTLETDTEPCAVSAFIERAARGEAAALSQLYAQQHASLRSFARRLLGDPHAAEDLVHDVFVSLPKALKRYRAECSLTTFLRAIAIRQASTHLRAAVRRRAAMHQLAQETERQARFPDHQLRQRELARLLTSALDQLSVMHRSAFVLCEVEGMSADEAAQVLAIPATTVRTRLFYARQKLSELMGGAP
jgi:RNA polymerase sigma-70 factor, ECF subfamily